MTDEDVLRVAADIVVKLLATGRVGERYVPSQTAMKAFATQDKRHFRRALSFLTKRNYIRWTKGDAFALNHDYFHEAAQFASAHGSEKRKARVESLRDEPSATRPGGQKDDLPQLEDLVVMEIGLEELVDSMLRPARPPQDALPPEAHRYVTRDEFENALKEVRGKVAELHVPYDLQDRLTKLEVRLQKIEKRLEKMKQAME